MSKTSEPPGLGAGTGARDSTELFVDWRVWMPMVPSKYAIASSSGFVDTEKLGTPRCPLLVAITILEMMLIDFK